MILKAKLSKFFRVKSTVKLEGIFVFMLQSFKYIYSRGKKLTIGRATLKYSASGFLGSDGLGVKSIWLQNGLSSINCKFVTTKIINWESIRNRILLQSLKMKIHMQS